MKNDRNDSPQSMLAFVIAAFGLVIGAATGILLRVFFTQPWPAELSVFALFCWGIVATLLLSLLDRWVRKLVPFDAKVGRSEPISIYRPDVCQFVRSGCFIIGFIAGMKVMS